MDLDDPYHELGLAPGCSDAEVKVAWRRLSARWHPDRNSSPHALRKIQRINRALEMIRNARGEPELEPEAPSAEPEPEAAAETESTIEHSISLTLEEVLTGCVKEVHGELLEDCAECRGNGLQLQPTACSECNGAGQIRQNLWFAWVSPTAQCSACQGQGNMHLSCTACAASGKANNSYSSRVQVAAGVRDGDLIDATARVQGSQRKLALRVRVELQPHEFFTAEADGTLKCEVPVDGFAWMANRWIEVPTPGGLQQMKLRRGHLNYRIKNAGLPWGNDAEAGDCIVTVSPLFPQTFSPAQEAAIDLLVASNSGKADTSAGEEMAAWTQLVDSWQARRI